MIENEKYDCKNCKHNESDICSDCQVTDEGIPTRYEAKNQDLDMHWLSLLFLIFAAFQQEEIKDKLGELKIQDYKETIEKMEKELRERQNNSISKPEGCFTSYYPMNYFTCFQETPSYQRDCYYYEEEQDMGARIPWCNKKGAMDPKDCNKECPYYITHTKIQGLIRKDVNNLVNSETKVIIRDGDELCPHCYQKLDPGYIGLRECYCKYCGEKIYR